MMASTKVASPIAVSGAPSWTASAQAATVTPTAANTGTANRSRTVSQLAPPHGSAGPTPARKRSATKKGALTRLNQTAPRLARELLETSTKSG